VELEAELEASSRQLESVPARRGRLKRGLRRLLG
jgi:hypothetical protein